MISGICLAHYHQQQRPLQTQAPYTVLHFQNCIQEAWHAAPYVMSYTTALTLKYTTGVCCRKHVPCEGEVGGRLVDVVDGS